MSYENGVGGCGFVVGRAAKLVHRSLRRICYSRARICSSLLVKIVKQEHPGSDQELCRNDGIYPFRNNHSLSSRTCFGIWASERPGGGCRFEVEKGLQIGVLNQVQNEGCNVLGIIQADYLFLNRFPAKRK